VSVPTNGEIDPEDLAYRIKINGCRGDATRSTRSRPNVATQRQILAKQNDRCMYCDLPFGTEILRQGRRGRLVTLRINWDHFVPYSWCATNPNDNWVAACHVCNGLKGPRRFETVGEARRYITNKALDKGYVYPRYA
jgi:hypothetical protein